MGPTWRTRSPRARSCPTGHRRRFSGLSRGWAGRALPRRAYPRVGFIVTNLSRPSERVVAFYNQRGTTEQHFKEGKNANKWTRLSCRKFRKNEVRLQLHALTYRLANFMRTLALPKEVEHWSLPAMLTVGPCSGG